MGQRGVYATIQKKPDGTYVVEHVNVQWALHLHHALNYILRDPERLRAEDCLRVLKDGIRDCVHVGAVEVLADDYKYLDSSLKDAHSEHTVWSLDKKDVFCVEGVLLAEEPGLGQIGKARTFKTRKAAEKFVFTHDHVQDAVSLLWDLDANTFTWFTEGDYYSIRAYNFATGQYEFCCRVTYSFEQMKAPEIEKVEFDGRSSSKDIIPLFGESSSPSEESPEKGETYTPAHFPGKTINYTMQRHDDGPATTVTGSIYSVSTPRVTRNFQGLTYTATLDTRFGFDTWVYKLIKDGKQVWRWSHTPKIDGQDGDMFLEGLYTAVATYDPDDMTEKMTKGLYYNDLDHVFESKILRTVETSLYRHLMEKTAPYGQKRISGLTKLLKDTLHRVDSAKNTEERKRLMARLVAYDRQADEFTLIPGGKEEVFREGGPKKGWFYFTYSVIVAAPVFVPEFDEGDLVSSVQVYTKEGYSQETIALLLGMTVKQVADIQKAGR